MDNKDKHGLNTPQQDDFQIKGAASKRKPSRSNDVEPESCTICLEAIQERAVAFPCNHLSFDFICLVQWLQDHATCPLCKADVKEVHYDWRSPEDFKVYTVGQQQKPTGNPAEAQQNRRRLAARRRREIPWGPSARSSSSSSSSTPNQEDPSLTRRRQVYAHRTPSLHVGANRISQHQNFTPTTFGSSPALQTRARIFLRRELRVFSFLDRRPAGANREFLIEYLIAVLKANDPKGADGHAEELLKDFLGREDARLLLHELDAWLRSPYERLEAWDSHAQYAVPPRGAGKSARGTQDSGNEASGSR
ncbi:hypothetical protein Q7P37_007264 [Cladosporium fusiforme]